MTDEKSSGGKHFPARESLEAKFKLLCLLSYDCDARRKHLLVFGFILDWYMSRYGDALASVRHIAANLADRSTTMPRGKALSRTQVEVALKDLVDWGYLRKTTGLGRRASRFVPAWELVCSADSVPASGDSNSVPGPGDMMSSPVGALTSVVAPAVGTKTPLQDPATKTPGTKEGGEEECCAAPSAPPGAGAEAPPRTDAAQGFDRLYRAYGVRRDKAAARVEFAKLESDANTIEHIIQAAAAWRTAAPAGMVRKGLAAWLREERFDEDPPRPHEPKSQAKPRGESRLKRAHGEAADQAQISRGVSHNLPGGSHSRIHIVSADVTERGGGRALVLNVMTLGDQHWGKEWTINLAVEDRDPNVQGAGQAALVKLVAACGLASMEDSSELVHGFFGAHVNGFTGTIDFVPRFDLRPSG